MVFGYGYSHFSSRSDKQMNAEAIANGESDENKNRKKKTFSTRNTNAEKQWRGEGGGGELLREISEKESERVQKFQRKLEAHVMHARRYRFVLCCNAIIYVGLWRWQKGREGNGEHHTMVKSERIEKAKSLYCIDKFHCCYYNSFVVVCFSVNAFSTSFRLFCTLCVNSLDFFHIVLSQSLSLGVVGLLVRTLFTR